MPQNVLFNYLNDEVSSPIIASIAGVRCRKKISLVKTQYYMLEITEGIGTIINGAPQRYTLNNHHVSVYETEDRYNPLMSQYHYTAEFSDDDEQNYRLHVYFDDNGNTTTAPVFEIRDEAGEYSLIAAEKCHSAFISLAKSSTQPFLDVIKQGLKTHIQTLEATYTRVESEACDLSRNISEEYEAYIDKLDEACQAAQALVPFVRNHQYYEGLVSYFHKLQRSINHQYSIEQTHQVEPQEAKELPSPTVLIPQPLQAPQPNSVGEEITALCSHFTALSQATDEAQAIGLENIRTKMQATLLLIEEQQASAPLKSLGLLHKLNNDIHRAGQSLYKRLLAARNIDGMRHLPDFHYLIEDKHLSFALLFRDAAYLAFILEHGNLDVNKPIPFKDRKDLSPVLYCFNAHTDAAPTSACLAVLLKHGASVLAEDAEGLPIAHTILSIPAHPLINVLTESISDKSKKTGAITFYKQLIAALQNYLLKDPEDKRGKNLSVRNAISKYEDQIRFFSSGHLSASDATFFGRSAAALRAQAADKIDLQRLDEEPELLVARRELMTEYDHYVSRLSDMEARNLRIRMKEVLGDGEAGFASLAKDIPEATPYETMKTLILEKINESTEQFVRLARLHDIQKKLKIAHYGPPSRAKKTLAAQEKVLVEQINSHDQKYNFGPQDSLKLIDTIEQVLEMIGDESRDLGSLPAGCAQQ